MKRWENKELWMWRIDWMWIKVINSVARSARSAGKLDGSARTKMAGNNDKTKIEFPVEIRPSSRWKGTLGNKLRKLIRSVGYLVYWSFISLQLRIYLVVTLQVGWELSSRFTFLFSPQQSNHRCSTPLISSNSITSIIDCHAADRLGTNLFLTIVPTSSNNQPFGWMRV